MINKFKKGANNMNKTLEYKIKKYNLDNMKDYEYKNFIDDLLNEIK
jgi:hypothetical protein